MQRVAGGGGQRRDGRLVHSAGGQAAGQALAGAAAASGARGVSLLPHVHGICPSDTVLTDLTVAARSVIARGAQHCINSVNYIR